MSAVVFFMPLVPSLSQPAVDTPVRVFRRFTQLLVQGRQALRTLI